MSDFTDDEDRQLVQLAVAFTSCGKLIPWDRLAPRMTHSTHSKDALRQRLKTLKRTHGKDLCKFPPWFFRKAFFFYVTSHERRKSKAVCSKSSLPPRDLVCHSHQVSKCRGYDDRRYASASSRLPLPQRAYHADATSEFVPTVLEPPPSCAFSPNVRMYECYEDNTKCSSLELLADVAAQGTNHPFSKLV